MKFEITKQDKVRRFIRRHNCSLKKDEFGLPKVGAIGGRITYCFTPTGLGVVEEIKCACGAFINITDYNSW